MKKVVLLMLFVFAGHSCFAKDAEIINPPIPVGKYKWLLIWQHSFDIYGYDQSRMHFVYTDEYKLEKTKLGDHNIILAGRFEESLSDDGNKPDYCGSMDKIRLLVYAPAETRTSISPRLDFFYKARVRSPNKAWFETHIFTTTFIPPTPNKNKNKPQKAKVVYR